MAFIEGVTELIFVLWLGHASLRRCLAPTSSNEDLWPMLPFQRPLTDAVCSLAIRGTNTQSPWYPH